MVHRPVNRSFPSKPSIAPQIFGSFWTNRNCTFCGEDVTSCLMIVEETGDGCPRREVARAGERSTWELRGDILRIFDWAVSRSDWSFAMVL